MTTYVTRDGSRLTPFMLYQINRLNTDLKNAFGVEVRVTSGIRTRQEHINIFLARYVTAGNVRGRRVYDTRVWKGVRYYRISSIGTVAVPGYSNHEVQGTAAAVDLRDTGRDGGIATMGSKRSNWLRANCGKYGMDPEGFNFGEAWHYRFRNAFQAVPGGGGGGSVSQDTKNRQAWLNKSRGEKLSVDGIEGPLTKAAYKRYQTFLKKSYGYKGAIDGIWGGGTQSSHQKYYDAYNKPKPKPKPKSSPKPSNPFGIPSVKGLQKIARLYGYNGSIDDIWGGGSASGFAQFLRRNHGYKGNDVLGPQMWAAIARWLRGRWGYKGNDVPGPVMRAALKRANDANFSKL